MAPCAVSVDDDEEAAEAQVCMALAYKGMPWAVVEVDLRFLLHVFEEDGLPGEAAAAPHLFPGVDRGAGGRA